MATHINANEASKIFSNYHNNPSQPKLKNSNGDPIQGFIIEHTDFKALELKAGADFAGIMAVPGHNSAGDDTLVLVGLKKIRGTYELVLPPNITDTGFIIDFIENSPPFPANTNFSHLSLPNWGC